MGVAVAAPMVHPRACGACDVGTQVVAVLEGPPRFCGDARQRQVHLLHRGLRMVGLQLAPDDAGSLPPATRGLLEVNLLAPGMGAVQDALHDHPAGVAPLHPGPGVGPAQQGVHRRQQQFHGRRGEGQGEVFGSGLLLLQGDERAVVYAIGQFPRPLSFRSEPVDERLDLHSGHVAQGVQGRSGAVPRGLRGVWVGSPPGGETGNRPRPGEPAPRPEVGRSGQRRRRETWPRPPSTRSLTPCKDRSIRRNARR